MCVCSHSDNPPRPTMVPIAMVPRHNANVCAIWRTSPTPSALLRLTTTVPDHDVATHAAHALTRANGAART
jgi:hypothetical protein